MNSVKQEYLKIHSDKVLEQIQAGDNKWENLVPNKVVNIIKEKGLFNWDQ